MALRTQPCSNSPPLFNTTRYSADREEQAGPGVPSGSTTPTGTFKSALQEDPAPSRVTEGNTPNILLPTLTTTAQVSSTCSSLEIQPRRKAGLPSGSKGRGAIAERSPTRHRHSREPSRGAPLPRQRGLRGAGEPRRPKGRPGGDRDSPRRQQLQGGFLHPLPA